MPIQVIRKKSMTSFLLCGIQWTGHQNKRKLVKISCPVVHWGNKGREMEEVIMVKYVICTDANLQLNCVNFYS